MIQFKEMKLISKKCISFYVIQLDFTNSLEIHPQILGKFAMQNFLKGMDRWSPKNKLGKLVEKQAYFCDKSKTLIFVTKYTQSLANFN